MSRRRVIRDNAAYRAAEATLSGIARDGITPDGGARDGIARDGGAPDGGARDGIAPDGIAPDGIARDGGARDGGARDGGARRAFRGMARDCGQGAALGAPDQGRWAALVRPTGA